MPNGGESTAPQDRIAGEHHLPLRPPKRATLPRNPINSHGADLAPERAILHAMSPLRRWSLASAGCRASQCSFLASQGHGPGALAVEAQIRSRTPILSTIARSLVPSAPALVLGGSLSYITASGTPFLRTLTSCQPSRVSLLLRSA